MLTDLKCIAGRDRAYLRCSSKYFRLRVIVPVTAEMYAVCLSRVCKSAYCS